MSNGICGKDCTLTGVTGVSTGTSWNLTMNGKEFDTTAFGDGDFGDWTVCGADGTIAVKSYDYCTADLGDAITWGSNVSGTVYSCNTVVQNKTITVDAKGIVEFDLSLRMIGDLSTTP